MKWGLEHYHYSIFWHSFITVFDRQRQQGRKVRRSNGQRRRKQIQKLEEKLKQVTKQCNKYERRYYRFTKQQQTTNPESPRSPATRVERIFQGQSVISPINRTLTFHYALVDDLRAKYKASRDTKAKRAIASIQTGRQIRRYKFRSLCQKGFGFSYKAGKQLRSRCEDTTRKRTTVRQFWETTSVDWQWGRKTQSPYRRSRSREGYFATYCRTFTWSL